MLGSNAALGVSAVRVAFQGIAFMLAPSIRPSVHPFGSRNPQSL